MNKTNKMILSTALILLAAFGMYALIARPKIEETEVPLYVQDLPGQQIEQADAAEPTDSESDNNGVKMRGGGQNSNAQLATAIQNISMENDTAMPCTASDIEGSANLQAAGTSVIGTVFISARKGVECSVAGNPVVHISDNNGPLAIQQNNIGPSSRIVLRSGDKAAFRVTWSNWCGRETSTLSFRVSLQGDRGYLLIPAISAGGQVQSTTPICTNIQGPSVISVGAFSR